MIRVDRRHDTIRCLAALALFCSHAAFAGSLVCSAERASGFVYDKQSQTWVSSNLPVAEKTYLVSPANENDIVASALKYDYEIREAGSSNTVIHCKAIRFSDSNDETGLIMCRGSSGASFNIDTQTGRYIRSQPTGYLTRLASTAADDNPYMEIGSCSAK